MDGHRDFIENRADAAKKGWSVLITPDSFGPIPSIVMHRFTALEGLRGYLAWWVVCAHAIALSGSGIFLPKWMAYYLQLSGVAINLFVILSGFVITHLLMSISEGCGTYITRRFFRIFPIYFISLLIAIALVPEQKILFIEPWGWNVDGMRESFIQQSRNFYADLFLHVFLLHGIVPDKTLPYGSIAFLGPAWSLSLEWQFYLLAPLLVKYLRSSKFLAIIMVSIFLLLAYALHHAAIDEWRFPSMILCSMHLFLAGIFSRLYLPRLLKIPLWQILIGGIFLGAVLWPFHLEIWIWALFLSALMAAEKGETTMYVRLLKAITSNRLMTTLGKVSYSTYLIHIPLMALLIAIGAKGHSELTQKTAQIYIAAAVLLLFPVSMIFYHLIESPFIRLGKHITKSSSSPPIPFSPSPITPRV